MPDMVHVRKAHAGTDSAGHFWPTDGAVIEVPVEHALVLARIPDGGFSTIESPPADQRTLDGQMEPAAEDVEEPKPEGSAGAPREQRNKG